MTQYLPSNLLALFVSRPPIPYRPPVTKLRHEKKIHGYSGVGSYMDLFEDPEDTPPPIKIENREERIERRRRVKTEQAEYKLEQEIALWKPHSVANDTTHPFKTLFVSRLNYDTSKSKLQREFELYGPIKEISVIHDKINDRPRGYAFIEYENERDMYSAFKHADGKKIDGRKVLVDVQRGDTVKGWLPRRFGGGLGGTRRRGSEVNVKHSGRENNQQEREKYAREMAYSHSRRCATPETDRECDYHDRDRDHEPRHPRSTERDRESNYHEREKERYAREMAYVLPDIVIPMKEIENVIIITEREIVNQDVLVLEIRKENIIILNYHGGRDVKYDVEEALVSKTNDKDHDRKRKGKRSRSKDRERKKNRKERDHHPRDKSKDGRDKREEDNTECDDKMYIKQELVIKEEPVVIKQEPADV